MKLRQLVLPAGYDPSHQSTVGHFAAALDDQLALLKEDIAAMTPKQLEWQPAPGMNTVGMLLAHNALVEVYWFQIAPTGMPLAPDGETVAQRLVGIGLDDDGMPAKADSKPPAKLAGLGVADYCRMLDAARAATHATLRHWADDDLGMMYLLKDKSISRAWTLYHVLEHFSGHYGQVLLLQHMMRDAKVS